MSDPLAHSGVMLSKNTAMNLCARADAMKLRARATCTRLFKTKRAKVFGYLLMVCLFMAIGFVLGGMVPRSGLGWVPTWIPDLLGTIFSVSWVASVGIPVIGTFAAVAAAGFYLTQQLSHDQRLARGERRRSQAAILANTLRDAASVLDRAIEVYEGRREWMSGESIETIIRDYGNALERGPRRAVNYFGQHQIFEDIDWSQRFEACFYKWIEASDGDGVLRPARLRNWTLASLIRDYHEFLVRTAEQLEDWDGGDSLPESGGRLPTYGSVTRLPGGGSLTFVRATGPATPIKAPGGRKIEWAEQQYALYFVTLEGLAEHIL
ncbi:hypothetical protein ACFVWF_32220 [Rhodococcus qingshengii]|uniref:hypothetical protein n=1 Tax=Rhodococcus qingshengii TaxID=334542 RepID=UPI0036D935C3